MTYEVLTPPIGDPVTLEEVKLHMHVDSADDNNAIEALIKAAVNQFELETNHAIMAQVWVLTLNTWPISTNKDSWWDGVRDGAISQVTTNSLHIEKSPFNTVTKIEIIDENDAFQTWAAANYYSIKNMRFGQLFAKDVNFPAPARDVAGIKITFATGHATASQVPYLIKNAILHLVEYWFEKKPEETPLPKAYLNAVASFKVIKI